MKRVIILLVIILSACTNIQTNDCIELKSDFDQYALMSRLPFTDSESLCYGLNMGSDFEDLPPKWAVGELIATGKYTLVFKGIENNVTLPSDGSYELGTNYMIDMNNICRYVFVMLDSRAPSPILQTIIPPIEISCD